ncbi:hypothetical protein DFH08DRAFT_874272 [Mycena albidolilacea]|uniref:Uncharacterized protein n=1 Tax=Mycena albidolilacea TaxID=1033008 RepID=A0AAD6ZVI7_9AGAR|nr:hypothetical protein DFH08DRAFT_874272 [Mycena albidolilacea]
MLFKTVYLAVCVLFTAAHASPGSVASGSKAVNSIPGPATIVNAGINETIFTFAGPPPLEVLLPAFGRKDQHATWDRYERRADAWVFKNRGTQQWLAVDEADDHLITVGDETMATVFAVESAGRGQVVVCPEFRAGC